MGRVYLIRPRWNSLQTEENYAYNRLFFPLSLAYCASLLKREGFAIVFYDLHGMRTLDIEEELSHIRPEDTVFVTSSDIERWICPQLDLEPFFHIVTLVKKRTEQVFLMGPHGSLDPDKMLRHTRAKAVIRGEPEAIILRLAQNENLRTIPGISYQVGDAILHNPDCEDLNLDELPFPDFSLLQHADYRYEIFKGKFVLLESTRNCAYSCTFCYRGMHGKTYRLKSVDRMIEEIKSAMRAGAKGGTFIDLDIAFNRSHMVGLCSAMREETPQFQWCCQTRPDHLDEDIISLMAQAGCRMIGFGIETADQGRLKSVRKKVDSQNVKDILEICKRHGIQTLGFFSVGYPGESLEEAQRTIDFGLQLRPTYLTIHFITGFKGTPFYDTIAGTDHWYRLEPSVRKREQLKKMIRRAYLKHYLRPSSIKTHLMFSRLPSYFLRVKLFLNYLR